ncbi:DUF2079 domain-containing protein [Kitasatospora sp. NPDC001683]
MAFAVPLLAFAATVLGRRRPLAAALWSLPLLLVKEYLGLTVAAVGLLIAWQARQDQRTPLPGLALAAVGVAATTLTLLVVLPGSTPAADSTTGSSSTAAAGTPRSGPYPCGSAGRR